MGAVMYVYVGPKKSKKPLHLDEKTKLWMKRMVYGEGGRRCTHAKAMALCWAIVNRWFLWPGARKYPTFISMMRAFSQPINPRWMTGGDLARKYIGREPASAARFARRARICAMMEFPRAIEDAVNQFADGADPLEGQRISNWASLKSTPKKYPWGYDVDGDWFFEDSNLKPGRVVAVLQSWNTGEGLETLTLVQIFRRLDELAGGGDFAFG